MVSKKVHKRANQRNYIKRTIREFFRTEQSDWMPLDLIVRAQKHFTPEYYPLIIAELKQLCAKFKLNSNVQKTSDSVGS
jgi:ribonuclease P protein component